MSLRLAHLFLLATPAVAQTVTITKDIPSSVHRCIRHCLFRPYNAGTDLGDSLECSPPYEEDCFCPTAAPRAEIVSQHIDDCANESCSAGDLTADIESMKSYYAAYCIDNGYTAELVEEWYTSATDEESSSTAETSEATTTEASTTAEAGETSTSTESSAVAETGGGGSDEEEEEDDGRNPDGLPEMDFEGNDDSAGNGLMSPRAGLFASGILSLTALLQWL